MEGNQSQLPLVRLRRRYPTRYDMGLVLFYMVLVYVWGLGIHPLGRDYAVMADPTLYMTRPAAWVFTQEVAAFGANAAGYHVVNLMLLYGCMVCVYAITRLTVSGPPWLAALAAVIFMAHPLHREAVLNLSGVGDLLPALLALGAIAAHGRHATYRTARTYGVALVLFAGAVLPFPPNLALVFVLLLLETLVVSDHKRSYALLAPHIALTIWSAWLYPDKLEAGALAPSGMFAPLYFLVYPLGFLPETALEYREQPWKAWGSAAIAVTILVFIAGKSRSSALWFAIAGAVAIRLFQGRDFVDPVHLVGGGRFVLPVAFLGIAVAALSLRIMKHPKWGRPVILFTTALCIALFAYQIRSVLIWGEAGGLVREWRESAKKHGGEGPAALVPNYQYYRGAPLELSEALSYSTPFSEPMRHVPVLELHYEKPEVQTVHVREWGPEGGLVEVRQRPIAAAAPWPYSLLREDVAASFGEVILQVRETTRESITVEILPLAGKLPKQTFPLESEGAP